MEVFGKGFGRARPSRAMATGTIALKIPKSISEAEPMPQRPAGARQSHRVPSLPGDTYITAVFLDDALPAAEGVLRRLLGNEANSAEFRTQPVAADASDPQPAGQPSAQGDRRRRFTLAEDLFLPGRSGDRVTLTLGASSPTWSLWRGLSGTGTGRYAKYLSTKHDSANDDRIRPDFIGGVTEGGAVGQHPTAGPHELSGSDRGQA